MQDQCLKSPSRTPVPVQEWVHRRKMVVKRHRLNQRIMTPEFGLHGPNQV
ncbi:hypothetical protein SBA4_4950010 [Candidatus Sulfopaludibacter sp. SbA4]|nr:hypothetical protein SBA4_4950010 [Candidatus Sulfopaludibacter sp. SbA4]